MNEVTSTREIYEFLPELLTLVEQTWGITLANTMMLPQLFAVLTFALMAVVSFAKIQVVGKPSGALKAGLVCGSALSAVGSLLLLTKSFGIGQAPSVVLAGGLAVIAGLVVIGSALIVLVHPVYDSAC